MSKLQRGFTIIETLIGLVVIAVLTGGGWWVWHNQHTKSTIDPPTAKNTDVTAEKPKFTDDVCGPLISYNKSDFSYRDWGEFTGNIFTLKYPSDWLNSSSNEFIQKYGSQYLAEQRKDGSYFELESSDYVKGGLQVTTVTSGARISVVPAQKTSMFTPPLPQNYIKGSFLPDDAITNTVKINGKVSCQSKYVDQAGLKTIVSTTFYNADGSKTIKTDLWAPEAGPSEAALTVYKAINASVDFK